LRDGKINNGAVVRAQVDSGDVKIHVERNRLMTVDNEVVWSVPIAV
jgi:hypothetical protein